MANLKKEGVKYDQGKPTPELLQLRAIMEVAKIMEYGKRKYDANNWRRGMDWSRLAGATLRHFFAFWNGKDYDEESGMLHLAHAAWNILSLLEYQLAGYTEWDDRWDQKLMTDDPVVKTDSGINIIAPQHMLDELEELTEEELEENACLMEQMLSTEPDEIPQSKKSIC
jgi:hypothetical protein